MADVTVTNVDLARNTGTVCTPLVLTAGNVSKLVITPTAPCAKLVLLLQNTAATAVKADVAAGDYWAGKAMTQVSVAQNTMRAFVFESAKNMKYVSGATANDKIEVNLTDGAADTTLYRVIQLP